MNSSLPQHTTLPAPHSAETGADVRKAARSGFRGLTVGRAPGYRQANLVVLPQHEAEEFLAYCAANPAPLPVLGSSEPGAIDIPALAEDLDIRTDVPRYQVHSGGTVTQSDDISSVWRDDLVAIALGCWFGAEGALADAGIRLRHVELGIQGPLFRTTLPTQHHGRFASTMVVSMRPFATSDVERVRAITSRLPLSHGAPLPFTTPEDLGIVDVTSPDWGEPLLAEDGETALFFACGLTSGLALAEAGLDFFITHAPGSMLVTDILEEVA
jgi:uncharacterized protein YcsI (UPF0317 family)